MIDGYIRVGAANIETAIADPVKNSASIIETIKKASQEKCQILVFNELTLSSYTLEDLIFQHLLMQKCEEELIRIVKATQDVDMVVAVGLPLALTNKIYNVAAIIFKGELLAFIPKTHVPNYHEFYEGRRFEKAPEFNTTIPFDGKQVPFGRKFVFKNNLMAEFTFGVEICEDLWVPNPPSASLALNGANVILNLSASNEITTKCNYRRDLVRMQSASLICGYVYASAAASESTTDLVFSGHNLICENGSLIKESPLFEGSVIYGDIDLQKLVGQRLEMTTYQNSFEYQTIGFDLPAVELALDKNYAKNPFVPGNLEDRHLRCQEVFNIQMYGLIKRLKATGIDKVVIGISGGLDSTLALLVCSFAFKKMGLDSKNITAITMPCFGTTSRTRNNAHILMDELGVTKKEIDITKTVLSQFVDLEHDINDHSVTYENVQARTRTQILMNTANKIGGLVIGTGDLSEVALGWSTYNGDHMSMYALNMAVPKTLVRYLVDYVASLVESIELADTLKDILATPVSPELLPVKEDTIHQITEDIVGPYELHDFFLYHFIRSHDRPRKLLRKSMLAYQDKYDRETILKWLRLFYRRFFTQQFKRSCIPDGPKVGTVSLSPRGDWRMPSDASYSLFVSELDQL